MKLVRGSGRLMLGGVFIASGVRALAFSGLAMRQTSELMDRLGGDQADPRWPVEVHTLVRLRGAMQLSAGVLLTSGYLRRPAAVVLAASLIPAVAAGRAFWNCEDPGERRRQRMHFLKDLGLLGGLLFLAVAGTENRPHTGSSAQGSFHTGGRQAHEAEHPTRAGRCWPLPGSTAARTAAITPAT